MPKEYVETFFSGRSKTTILFVDDQPNMRLIGLHLFQELGFTRVLLAKNGQEALELYKAHAEDILLVFSDLQMPEMCGVTLFHSLKELNPSLRMVISSGSDPGADLHPLFERGLKGFLPKPFGFDQFGLAVAGALL